MLLQYIISVFMRLKLEHPLYGEIDNSFVYEYIKNDFGDILEFKRLILIKAHDGFQVANRFR